MLRERLKESLKEHMLVKNQHAVSTVRLILAALKDRDIAARGKGNTEGITEEEIFLMLQTMVKQRHESISMYERGGRPELAQQEADEITIIEQFLPTQLDDGAAEAAVVQIIEELKAENLKAMGSVMGALRERYTGQLNFAKAGAIVKQRLS
jgi:uncharacterized protein YqeY